MTFTRSLATNNYGPMKFIVDGTTVANGTHSTISAALTSAVSGDTIFIRPGTYTENLTLKVGVNLCANTCDALTPNVTIVGTCTLTTAGVVSISGIRLQTNSAALIAVTGSAASILNLTDCYLNCTNATGITFSSSSGSAVINITNCKSDLGTTGIGLFSHSSGGSLRIMGLFGTNTGSSLTTSTCSAGVLDIRNSLMNFPIAYSSAGTGSHDYVTVDNSSTNTTSLAQTGTGTVGCHWCRYLSGSASSISVGSGCTLNAIEIEVSSSNTNAITGAGTLSLSNVSMTGSSSTINTSTVSSFPTVFGGIKFNKESDTLNTYVVGTFTPTIVGTVAGTTTYSTQVGNYVKIGNIVTVSATLVGTGATGTGSNIIGGFPFTSKNATTNYYGSILIVNAAGWTWPALTTSAYALITTNAATGSIDMSGTGSAFGALQMANAAFNMQFTITYQI